MTALALCSNILLKVFTSLADDLALKTDMEQQLVLKQNPWNNTLE